MKGTRLGASKRHLPLDVTYKFSYASILSCLEDATSPTPEFPTRMQYNVFRDSLSTIFTSCPLELHAEVSNNFGFEGVSDYDFISTGASEYHLSSAPPQAPSPMLLKEQGHQGQAPDAEEILRATLRAYAAEVDGAVKGACMISDSDPLLISQSFNILLAIWNDFRTKLANVSTLFTEYGLSIQLVRRLFIEFLEYNLITKERADKIVSLICNGITACLIGSAQPNILSLRSMVSLIGAVNTQYVDALVDRLIASISTIIKGKLSGLLANRHPDQKATNAFLRRVQLGVAKLVEQSAHQDMSFSSTSGGNDLESSDDGDDDDITPDGKRVNEELDRSPSDKTGPDETEISIPYSSIFNSAGMISNESPNAHLHYDAPKLSEDVCVAILGVISLLNGYTEVLAYLLQTAHLEIPTRVSAALMCDYRVDNVFLPSAECLTLIRLQPNISHLRTRLLLAVFDEIDVLMKSPHLSYVVIFYYFTGGKGLLYYLYQLAHEAKERCGLQGNNYLVATDNFIARSFDLAAKYIYKTPGSYVFCIDKLLKNPHIMGQRSATTDIPSFPIAQVLAVNLLYITSVAEDFQATLGPLLSNSLLVTLHKMQSNLSNGRVYELESLKLRTYVHTAAYMDLICYNGNRAIVSASIEAILVLVDSIIRLICLMELKMGELDELFCGSQLPPYIAEYLATLSSPHTSGLTFEAVLRRLFAPSLSMRLPYLLLCAICIYSSNLAALAPKVNIQAPATTVLTAAIESATIVTVPKGTRIPWEKILMHKPPSRRSRITFKALFDVVETLGRLSWPILGSCMGFLRQNDSDLASVVTRMVSLSLHRFLCFSTSHPLLVLEQELYMEFGSGSSLDDIAAIYHQYLNNITNASNIVHAARNITMSTNNYVMIGTAFKTLLDDTFIHTINDAKQSWLTDDLHKVLMAFVSGHIKVVSPILKSILEASDVPTLHVLSASGVIIICTKEIADVMEYVMRKGRVFTEDLVDVIGKNFASIYPQMLHDKLLVIDQKGYLTMHPDLLEERDGSEQCGDSGIQDSVDMFFDRKRCDYFCFSYVNEGSYYKHLDCYAWYYSMDSLYMGQGEQQDGGDAKAADFSGPANVVNASNTLLQASSLITSQQGSAVCKDTNTITALVNAYIVRLLKVCGPLNKSEVLERCMQEVAGISTETVKASVDNLIDLDYLGYVDNDPTILEYIP